MTWTLALLAALGCGKQAPAEPAPLPELVVRARPACEGTVQWAMDPGCAPPAVGPGVRHFHDARTTGAPGFACSVQAGHGLPTGAGYAWVVTAQRGAVGAVQCAWRECVAPVVRFVEGEGATAPGLRESWVAGWHETWTDAVVQGPGDVVAGVLAREAIACPEP